MLGGLVRGCEVLRGLAEMGGLRERLVVEGAGGERFTGGVAC